MLRKLDSGQDLFTVLPVIALAGPVTGPGQYDISSERLRIDLNGAVGRMVASVLFGLAEIEMDYRRERQAAGIVVAKRRGLYAGRRAGTTKAKPARAKALRQQGLTATEIAHALAVSPRTVFRYLAPP